MLENNEVDPKENSLSTTDLYKALEPKISLARRGFQLVLTEQWQLQALSGDKVFYEAILRAKNPEILGKLALYAAWSDNAIELLDLIKARLPALLASKDARSRTLAHYAGLSGNVLTLKWISRHRGELMIDTGVVNNFQDILEPEVAHLADIRDWDGLTIAHYGAFSGSVEILSWIKSNKPGWLHFRAENGATVAHWAAFSGREAALEWFKLNIPKLLGYRDHQNRTIAHYAAASGSLQVLKWIRQNKWELLITKNSYNIPYYALASANPSSFNYSLDLKGIKSTLILPVGNHLPNLISVDERVYIKLSTISFVLKSNYNLTTIKNLRGAEVDSEKVVEKTIERQLLRNKGIQKSLQVFMAFLQGQHQKEAFFFNLPSPFLKQLLGFILDERIPEPTLLAWDDEITKRVNPQTRNFALHKINLQELINKRCQLLYDTSLRNSCAIFLRVTAPANKKITILKELLDLISANQVDNEVLLREKIFQWEEQNQQIIDHQRNRLYAFFKTHKQTATRKLLTEIKGEFFKLDEGSKAAVPVMFLPAS